MSDSARPDPLWSSEGASFRERFSALGLEVLVGSNENSMIELARRSFGYFEPALETAPSMTIDVVMAYEPRTLETPRTTSIRHRERAGLFTATDGASMLAADLQNGRAALFVDSCSDPEIVRRDLLEAIVWRFATWQGMIAIHAATVVVGNRSLVLRGPGGAGKSTLAYAAVRAGHVLVAEEVTWYDPGQFESHQSSRSGDASCFDQAGRAQLRGAPWRISLEESAHDLFPGLTVTQASRSASAKLKLTINLGDELGDWRTAERAPLGPIVFLEPQGKAGRTEASTWRRLEPAEAESRFLTGAIVGEYAQPHDAYRTVAGLLISQGAFALQAGRPADAVRALEEIVIASTGPSSSTSFMR